MISAIQLNPQHLKKDVCMSASLLEQESELPAFIVICEIKRWFWFTKVKPIIAIAKIRNPTQHCPTRSEANPGKRSPLVKVELMICLVLTLV